ncbi:MAG: ATP synthase F1 subunit delta [Actinobacteria bacterium 69-20]|jgi:F-type H+-transporting ATPase subunit delta|nr:F0F1 ATP synthase subunit delta [Actinomycetota bacterium]OJV30215.1 MAG: ATP synthase F1 subunit delta [Actinobacteria bacterium 69-20]
MAGLASQHALTASTGTLLTTAATLDEAALAAVAGDFAGAAAVLAGQPHLRRMLTETTVSGEAKANLVRRLFDGKIGATSLTLLASVAKNQWSTGTDLVDGLRRLSRTALFLEAERAGELDDVEDELFRFGRIIDAHPEISVILDDPAVSATARADLVSRLLAGKAHPLTTELLTSLARDLGGRTFGHGVAELVEQAAERRDKLVAIVTSPVALSAAETGRLRVALTRIYSREIAVHVLVDPALRGGLTVRVGDEVIDGSVSGRLDAVRARLTR